MNHSSSSSTVNSNSSIEIWTTLRLCVLEQPLSLVVDHGVGVSGGINLHEYAQNRDVVSEVAAYHHVLDRLSVQSGDLVRIGLMTENDYDDDDDE